MNSFRTSRSARTTRLLATAVVGTLVVLAAGCSKPAAVEPPSVAAPSAMPSSTTPPLSSDAELSSSVKAALRADDSIKSFEIAVDTLNGEVRLSGTLDTQVQIDRALVVARAVTGVRGVQNTLVLKG
jgi:hyperosmotically inducible protein